MLEPFHRPLLSRRRFARRMIIVAAAAIGADAVILAAGAIGYHFLARLGWLDASVTAAMVMTGNGAPHPMQTVAGKVFVIFDALLGVTSFVIVVGVFLMPVFHRILHRCHIAVEPDGDNASP